MKPRRSTFIRTKALLMAAGLAVSALAGCGSNSNNGCIRKCGLSNHAYYLDKGERRVAEHNPDAITRAILDAGYGATAHQTGYATGDPWTLIFTPCAKGADSKKCTQAAGTIAKPKITRETKPGSLDDLGQPDFLAGTSISVIMGKVNCVSVAPVTAAGLKQLPAQVQNQHIVHTADGTTVPPTGITLFLCNA